MIVIEEQTTMMTTSVLARLREDAAEDHQVVVAVVHRTMDRVVTLTTVHVVQVDHAVPSRRMTPRLMSLTEPDQKVSCLSSYQHYRSQRVNLEVTVLQSLTTSL
jgi:hypothetical protein